MNIRKIKVENVRGISSKEISLDMHPNKVTFFVAPNGFGKTSIAKAFASLKRGKIELAEEDRYKGDSSVQPLMELTADNGTVYRADSSSNSISEKFSVCVINSQVRPKAITRNFGRYSASSPSLIVDPVVLFNTIPNKREFAYSYTSMKASFEKSSRKLVANLNAIVKVPAFVLCMEKAKHDIAKLTQVRLSGKISDFILRLNSIQGTREEMLCVDVDAGDLLSSTPVGAIAAIFDQWFCQYTANEKVVNVVQIQKLFEANQESFTDVVSYNQYIKEKGEVDEILSYLNCTWKNICTARSGQKLVINFPKANEISNGERDVLCFVGKLFEAKSRLRKDQCILIIDEIFDYLDDANLIAAQYFLTKFIEQFKISGKSLYVVLLTHLDPVYFNTYSFFSKNIVYLSPIGTVSNKFKINDLLKDRDKCRKTNEALYSRISKHFLHYSTEVTDERAYLTRLGVSPQLYTSDSFRNTAFEELDKYISGLEYDPILVCCGVRLRIEKNAYDLLEPAYRNEFLNENKTTNKLVFAKEKGANIPEVYFLLSIIYNEAMHLDPQCKKLSPIKCKLTNKVIHKMISEL